MSTMTRVSAMVDGFARLDAYDAHRMIAGEALEQARIAADTHTTDSTPSDYFAQYLAACYKVRGVRDAAAGIVSFREAYNVAAAHYGIPTIGETEVAQTMETTLGAYLTPAEIEEIRVAYWPLLRADND